MTQYDWVGMITGILPVILDARTFWLLGLLRIEIRLTALNPKP